MDQNEEPIPRAEVRAVLAAIRANAGTALTAPVHHAYAECALKLEQLLGEDPGTPKYLAGAR